MCDLNNVNLATFPLDIWNRTCQWKEHPIELKLIERLSHWFNEYYISDSEVPDAPSFSSSYSLSLVY